MRRLEECAGQELLWLRSERAHPRYELRARREVLARLDVPAEHGVAVVGEAADQRWHFIRHGALARSISIEPLGDANGPCASGPLLFTTDNASGIGLLDLPAGGRYGWQRTGFAFPGVTFAWSDLDGQPLLSYTLANRFSDARGHLRVERLPAEALPALPLLAVLGWYLAVLRVRRTQTAILAR